MLPPRFNAVKFDTSSVMATPLMHRGRNTKFFPMTYVIAPIDTDPGQDVIG